jgi:Ribbon-helix-helix protein, copG family
VRVAQLDRRSSSIHMTFMALSLKKATTIALDLEDDRLLTSAARERGVSRSEFILQHLAIVLEQYRRRPRPRSAGVVRTLTERGDERDVCHFAAVRLGNGQALELVVHPTDPDKA